MLLRDLIYEEQNAVNPASMSNWQIFLDSDDILLYADDFFRKLR